MGIIGYELDIFSYMTNPVLLLLCIKVVERVFSNLMKKIVRRKFGRIFRPLLIMMILTLDMTMVIAQAIEVSKDNDFFIWYDQTDRYYTYGISGTYYERLKEGRVNFLMNTFPKTKGLIEHYSLNIKAYTPGNTAKNIRQDAFDRPFAGWAFVQYGVIGQIEDMNFDTGVNVGVMGPAARAGRLQNWFHERIGDEKVEGWDDQIVNQLGINAYLRLRRSMISIDWAEIILEPELSIGSITTHMSTGARLRIGRFNDLGNTFLYNTNVGKANMAEYFFTFMAGIKVIGYNATVQGGIFNDQFLPARDLNRIVGMIDFSANVKFQRFAFDFRITHTKGEVAEALDHKYGSLGLYAYF